MDFTIGPDLIEYYEDEIARGPDCPHCGGELERELCDQCDGDGLYGHDCGEDCCCCLDPEENEPCDLCGGDGGWWVCFNQSCTSKKDDDYATS